MKADIENYFTSKDTEANGLGWISEARMAALQDALLDLNVIEKKVPVNELFTTRFLK